MNNYFNSLKEAAPPFKDFIGGALLTKDKIDTLQLNITRACNLACKHCHVQCSPARKEDMSMETAKKCVEVFRDFDFEILDITGGAPEMSGVFEYLVDECSKYAKKIMIRSNLTIYNDEKYKHIPEFLKKHKVTIIASLPFYEEARTDKVRGIGVFHDSIKVLKELNSIGYGIIPELELNLVYNPSGAILPGNQEELEEVYRTKLKDEFGIVFNNLFSMTNCPIGRFGEWLDRSGNMNRYLTRLVNAFNPETVDEVMCRNTLSVDYDGSLHDCDFNLALGIKIKGKHKTIFDIEKSDLTNREIMTFNHCYSCTAGAGSSWGGSLE